MLHDEKTISFTEAATVVGNITGKAPHPSTVWRWGRLGIMGVRLDTQRLGRTFVTSIEALDRFSKALADASPERSICTKPTSKQRQASIEQAETTLRRVGIL